MADVFPDRMERSLKNLQTQFGDKVKVPQERQFLGMDAYKKAIAEIAPGGVALLTTPPAFRPIHFEHAVAADCNVFMEKSFAVDAPGVRRVLKTGEEATKKNLKVAGGLMSRHYQPLEEAVKQIHDGAIGDVITCWAYRVHGPVGFQQRKPGESELAAPDPQLLVLHLGQRQLHPGLADPQSGRLLLGQGRLACPGTRAGRTPGSHAARSAVRPLCGGVRVRRRNATVRSGAAHRQLLGILRRCDPRLARLCRAGRRYSRSEDLQRLQARRPRR